MSRSPAPFEHHYLHFGSQRIPVLLRFSGRRNLSITVQPDLRVIVSAPGGQPRDVVLERVRRRAGWIVRQVSYFEGFHPLPAPRKYVSGETHLYLGRQLRLRVRVGDRESVKLTGPFLVVSIRANRSCSCVKRLLDRWYKQRACVVLQAYVDKCLSAARSLELGRPRIKIRKLAKRWGSCTKGGTILLNSDLIRTPPYCIEYVIMHELCHLLVHDHSQRFFELLTRFMPDWERRKRRLDQRIH